MECAVKRNHREERAEERGQETAAPQENDVTQRRDTVLADDVYSRLDLQAIFRGHDVPFNYWSLMVAPLCGAIAREHKLTITKSLTVRLALAYPVRHIMVWRLRRDEDWRLQELIERQSQRVSGG